MSMLLLAAVCMLLLAAVRFGPEAHALEMVTRDF